jgi:hypothetical protein
MSLALASACAGPEPAPEPPPPTYEERTQRLEEAKQAARDAAVAQLYEEWRRSYAQYRASVAQVLDAEGPGNSTGGPVRPLEELLREADPETHDPRLAELRRHWLERSEEFDRQLRALQSDPRTDPRSPLLPEVREALEPAGEAR